MNLNGYFIFLMPFIHNMQMTDNIQVFRRYSVGSNRMRIAV